MACHSIPNYLSQAGQNVNHSILPLVFHVFNAIVLQLRQVKTICRAPTTTKAIMLPPVGLEAAPVNEGWLPVEAAGVDPPPFPADVAVVASVYRSGGGVPVLELENVVGTVTQLEQEVHILQEVHGGGGVVFGVGGGRVDKVFVVRLLKILLEMVVHGGELLEALDFDVDGGGGAEEALLDEIVVVCVVGRTVLLEAVFDVDGIVTIIVLFSSQSDQYVTVL